MNTRTCEFVSPKHPDKICDFLADSVLDAFMRKDKGSRVAIEVMGGHRRIFISGEVTSKAQVDIQKVVQDIVGRDFQVRSYVEKQSPFIARGVDTGGAGDQGIMVGYATRETPEFLPKEYVLARDLCKTIFAVYPYDGKTQVTLEGDTVRAVVASFQNAKTADLERLVRKNVHADEYSINPAGEWTLGGFDSDTGLSGRKIVIDNYGPQVGIGGGSFSGKDYTKVDRSGAYAARKLAVDLLKSRKANEVKVSLAYAIGKRDPVMAVAHIDGKEESLVGKYDLSTRGIYAFLDLGSIKWANTAAWGHFGRSFPWQ